MSKGFDTATPLTTRSAAFFAGLGFLFVGRYLSEDGSWKRLSPQEAQLLSDAGIYIVSLYERAADRVKGGAAAGTEDGRSALRLAQEVGQPVGTAIYAAVDYDASFADADVIEAYMRAFDAEITGYELGVYGSYGVVKEMHARGVTNKLMQTYAWSRGKKYEPISIYQYQNDIVVGGIGIDYCESNGDAGGWQVGMAIQQKPALDADVAQTIINTWIAPAWHDADHAQQVQEVDGDVAEAAKLEEQKVYCNWLANQLRQAAGLPMQ